MSPFYGISDVIQPTDFLAPRGNKIKQNTLMGEPLRATRRIHQKAFFLVMKCVFYSDGFLQRLLVKLKTNQKYVISHGTW